MNNQLEKLKSDFAEYLNKKEILQKDILRIEGILVYIENEIKLLTNNQN